MVLMVFRSHRTIAVMILLRSYYLHSLATTAAWLGQPLPSPARARGAAARCAVLPVQHAPATAGVALSSTTSSLHMVQTRGMEVRTEGATPTAGGMTLYCKAGQDGVSIGDCPFCQYVRMVLEEKGLQYELRPSTANNKPQWLIDSYDGKMPALRHRKECYVESDVIVEYLDFFFPQPPLQEVNKQIWQEAQLAIDGFFPVLAKYIKHVPDGDEEDLVLQEALAAALTKLDTHLQNYIPYLCGEHLTLLDCGLAPKLYVLRTGLEAFKSNAIRLEHDYTDLYRYMESVFARQSFQKTVYPVETGVWGWSNARSK